MKISATLRVTGALRVKLLTIGNFPLPIFINLSLYQLHTQAAAVLSRRCGVTVQTKLLYTGIGKYPNGIVCKQVNHLGM